MKSIRPTAAIRCLLPCLLLAAAALLAPEAAWAQWATNGDNINSTNTGNVGIGTSTSPAEKLEIFDASGNVKLKIGTGGASANSFLVMNAAAGRASVIQKQTGGANAGQLLFYASNDSAGRIFGVDSSNNFGDSSAEFMVKRNGNVGFGTTNPGYRLHVAGNNTASGGYPILKLQNTDAAGRSWWLYSGAGGQQGAFGLYDETAAAYRMFFDTSGSVGFGSTSPSAARVFAVTGGSGAPADSGTGTLTSLMGASSAGSGTAARGVYGYANVLSVTNGTATGVKGLGEAVNLYEGQTAYGGFFAGKAGSSYGYTRSVYGLYAKGEMVSASVGSVYGGYFEATSSSTNATTSYAVFASATGNGTNYGIYSAAGTNYFGGRVGIGTASPNAAYKLDVQGGQINASGGLCIAGDCKTAWSQVGGGSPSTLGAVNVSAGQFAANTGGGTFTFPATVGIGTTTPNSSYKLDVNGSANVAGNISATGSITGGTIEAKYQDLAEWVPSEQKLSAGTVVVLDTERVNHVLASTASYDTKVAGVISARPGIALGEGGEGKVLVATTGRVKVKVDATKGPIKVGDLLVTSDVEGVAMKSVPVELGGRKMHSPGTIIGKALEPLEKGVGEILVLLSLQ